MERKESENKLDYTTTLILSECFCPLKINVEILMLNVKILWGGAFGRCLGHKGRAHTIGISALMEETPQGSLASFTM